MIDFVAVNAEDFYRHAPTRKCGICGFVENKEAFLVEDRFWLCEKCRKKIGMLIGVKTYG